MEILYPIEILDQMELDLRKDFEDNLNKDRNNFFE